MKILIEKKLMYSDDDKYSYISHYHYIGLRMPPVNEYIFISPNDRINPSGELSLQKRGVFCAKTFFQ